MFWMRQAKHPLVCINVPLRLIRTYAWAFGSGGGSVTHMHECRMPSFEFTSTLSIFHSLNHSPDCCSAVWSDRTRTAAFNLFYIEFTTTTVAFGISRFIHSIQLCLNVKTRTDLTVYTFVVVEYIAFNIHSRWYLKCKERDSKTAEKNSFLIFVYETVISVDKFSVR